MNGMMRTIRYTCLLTLLVALVLQLGSVHAANESLQVVALDHGDRYWFEIADHEGKNPPLDFQAGDEVTVELLNGGSQPHTIHFGVPIGAASDFIAPGTRDTFTFVVPDEEVPYLEYWCDPHRDRGMYGAVTIAADGTAGANEPSSRVIPVGAPLSGLMLLMALGATGRIRRR